MMALPSIVALLAVCAAVAAIGRHRFQSKIRMVQWGKVIREGQYGAHKDFKSFIRLYPNPGFTIFGFHWCKASGRGKH